MSQELPCHETNTHNYTHSSDIIKEQTSACRGSDVGWSDQQEKYDKMISTILMRIHRQKNEQAQKFPTPAYFIENG